MSRFDDLERFYALIDRFAARPEASDCCATVRR